MRTINTISAFAALAFTSHMVLAQSKFLEGPEQTKRAAEAIVASAAASNINGALTEFQHLSVIQGSDFEVFKAQVFGAQEKLLQAIGAPTGYEYIRQDAIGTRVLRQQFLVFHEKASLLWSVVFFKQEQGWVITHLHFEGNALSFFR